MELNFFSSQIHPALICHRRRHLILFTKETDRLQGRVSSLFDLEAERVIPVALTALDLSIQKVEELLLEGHLPEIEGEEIYFTVPPEGGRDRLLMREIEREIERLSREEVEATRHPDHLYCPVSRELFLDPYSNQFGHTFEREVITKIYDGEREGKRPLCPISRQEMTTPPTPNYPLREAIDRIRSTPPIPLLPAMEGKATGTDLDRANRFREMAGEEWKRGDKDGAIALLIRAFQAAEKSDHYLFLAQIYRASGESRKAHLASLHLARLQIRRGELEGGFETIQPLYQAFPALYALLIGSMGKKDGACRILRREARQIGGKRGLDYWEWALSLNPLSPGLFEEVPSSNPALFASLGSLYWRGDREESDRLQKRALELAPNHPTVLWGAVLSGRSDLSLFRALSTLSPTDLYALKRTAESGDLEDIWRYIDLLVQQGSSQEGYHVALQWADRWLEGLLFDQSIELLSRSISRFQPFFQEKIALKIDFLERLMTAYTEALESNHGALKKVVDELGSYYESIGDWESAIRVHQKADHHLHSHETSLKLGRALGRRSKKEGIDFLYQIAKPLFATQEYRLVGQYIDQIREIAPLDQIGRIVDPLVGDSICSQSAAIDLFRQLEEVRRELSLHTRQLEEMRQLIPFYIPQGTIHPGRFFTTPSMGSHYPQGSRKDLFGSNEWTHFFRFVPPVSLDLERVASEFNQSCPFISGRSIGETHRLLLIPREISYGIEESRRGFIEERLEAIFQALSRLCSSNKIKLLSQVPRDNNDPPFSFSAFADFAQQFSRPMSHIGLRSYWLLVANEPFDSENAPPGYRKLDLVELVVSAMTEYVISGHASCPFKALGGRLFDRKEVEIREAILLMERNLKAVKDRMAIDSTIASSLKSSDWEVLSGHYRSDYYSHCSSYGGLHHEQGGELQLLRRVNQFLQTLLNGDDLTDFRSGPTEFRSEPIRGLKRYLREGVAIDGIMNAFVAPHWLKRVRFGVKGVESGVLAIAPLDEGEKGTPLWGREISFDPPGEIESSVIREEELRQILSQPPSSGASSSSSSAPYTDY